MCTKYIWGQSFVKWVKVRGPKALLWKLEELKSQVSKS
jgi:hypothetical protein